MHPPQGGRAGVVAAAAVIGLRLLVAGPTFSPLLTLMLGTAVFMAVYLCVLLFVMKQSTFYMEILRGLRGQSDEKGLVMP